MTFEYLEQNNQFIKKTAAECALFFKKDNNFPLTSPCKISLVGNGVRHTIKGGTGSGMVFVKDFINIEDAFKNAGFTIVTNDWLDAYDEERPKHRKAFIKRIKKEAKQYDCNTINFCFGHLEEEHEFIHRINIESDVAIYVLSRQSGEGHDRDLIKGDVYLTDSEIMDINYLNSKFKKFMLVLNVGSPIDLTPVINVKNILLLSQLGIATGEILANIVLGKDNPSGKLASTWYRPIDHEFFNDFLGKDETYYKEGIYVGYRYFDAANIKPMFPFGFGLNYSSFEIAKTSISNKKDEICIDISVKNISQFEGKEVIQAYLSQPQRGLPKPVKVLVGFAKTPLVKPNQTCAISIRFNLRDFATYYPDIASYKLDKGNYIVSIGNSSDNLNQVACICLEEDVVTSKLKNLCVNNKLQTKVFDVQDTKCSEGIPIIKLSNDDFNLELINYDEQQVINEKLKNLKTDDLIYLCIGHFTKNSLSFVGDGSVNAIGGAGETSLHFKDIPSLTMADGPAGIRITPSYVKKKNKIVSLEENMIIAQIADFLPSLTRKLVLKAGKNKKVKGEVHYQYTSCIPIATALAQTFNLDLVTEYGRIVASDMKRFNIDIWLAPALNLHRSMTCGRNFEYYSEDPLVSGLMASAVTNGVQNGNKQAVCLKHFACNNQEFNRYGNNSNVDERTLRELYLKGFEIAIKKSHPHAIMTSYNLLNGTHTAENSELLQGILRKEWGFSGITLSDWMQTNKKFIKDNKYRNVNALGNIMGGTNISMPGYFKDYKLILNSIKKKLISREDILKNASYLIDTLKKMK